MWQEILVAVALLLVLEGIMPFLNPGGMKRAMLMMSQMDDSGLRYLGLGSMIVGVMILYFIR